MPRISADYNKMLSAAGEFKSQSKRIGQIGSDILSIMNKIPLQTTFFTAAKTRMLVQYHYIKNISNKYSNIGSAIEEIERTYQLADKRAGGTEPVGYEIVNIWRKILMTGPISNNWKEIINNVFDTITNSAIYNFFMTSNIPYTHSGADAIRRFLNPGYIGIPGILLPPAALIGLIVSNTNASFFNDEDEVFSWFGSAKGSFKGGAFTNVNDNIKDKYKKSGDYNSYSWNSDSKKQGLQDKNATEQYSEEELKNKKDANKFMSREAQLEIAGKSKEYSVFKSETKIEGEAGSFDANLKVGKAEKHAGVGIGVYSTKDADGNTHHGVGVYGEVGGSVSAIEGDIKGRLGSENFGVYAKAEGKALSGSATAGVNVGTVDGKVQAYVGGKAEAVLVEGSISGGVTIAGADVGVKATGKVGIGANANVGYKDGHIVLDVGASLGVGGEISLDIDVSKPVEVIGNGVKEAGKAIKSAAKGAKEFFGSWFK